MVLHLWQMRVCEATRALGIGAQKNGEPISQLATYDILPNPFVFFLKSERLRSDKRGVCPTLWGFWP